jgi:hypothetical protein
MQQVVRVLVHVLVVALLVQVQLVWKEQNNELRLKVSIFKGEIS